MKYVTIMDIAHALGVSKSTVSRALAGDVQNVKPETMELICETARRMGYRRNEAAVNLRRQHSKTIGIVIPEVVTSFFMNFIQFAQPICGRKAIAPSLPCPTKTSRRKGNASTCWCSAESTAY